FLRCSVLRSRRDFHQRSCRASQEGLETRHRLGVCDYRRAEEHALRAGNVNPRLRSLQPYPFEKLRGLFEGVKPNPRLAHISLGIGEPQHPTPDLIKRALSGSLAKLASYPPTAGGAPPAAARARWAVALFRPRFARPKTPEVSG